MALTDLVAVPAGINQNVMNARQATMLALLGNPRDSYDQECREITNPRLAALMTTDRAGPLHVRGLRPAVESLKQVVADIKNEVPAVFDALGTAGMFCARLVRGSQTSISNHSWGTAIDLTLDGVLDERGDDRVQVGLTRIFPIFNRHGWYWGAGFPVEDGMHFECGDDLIRKFAQDGALGDHPVTTVERLLSLGDRGEEVARLQRALVTHGAATIAADGDFGRGTLAAVMAFQAAHHLTVDGVAGRQTLAALGIA